MRQMAIPLAGLPLALVLLSGGAVAIVPQAPISAILETDETLDVRACFYKECFTLTLKGGEPEEYDYSTAYYIEVIPALKQWLKQQNMPSPFPKEE